jgi:hypothetical protein
MTSPVRRRLLAGTLALVTGALPFSRSFAATSRTITGRSNPWSNDSRAEVWLGQSYLRLHPEENSAKRITYLLSGDRFVSARELIDCAELRQSIWHQRDEDFRKGNVVLVDGWVLTRTEARMFALTAIESVS